MGASVCTPCMEQICLDHKNQQLRGGGGGGGVAVGLIAESEVTAETTGHK